MSLRSRLFYSPEETWSLLYVSEETNNIFNLKTSTYIHIYFINNSRPYHISNLGNTCRHHMHTSKVAYHNLLHMFCMLNKFYMIPNICKISILLTNCWILYRDIFWDIYSLPFMPGTMRASNPDYLIHIGGSLLTSLFTFLLICIALYVQKGKC